MKDFFSIPADFKIQTLKKIISENEKLETKIMEVYGSYFYSDYGSGRKNSILPKVDLDELKKYVDFCNSNKITFNYTLNFTCIENSEFKVDGKKKIIDEIKRLNNIGIKNFTISNPAIIDILEEIFPNLKITVSIITGIDSIEKMEYFCQLKNVDSIYIHEKIYRQTGLLKDMIEVAHNYGKKVGVIVNSTCLSDCPFRAYHYNFCSHSKNDDQYIIEEYYCTKCKIEKLKDKRKVLTMPWIRPEDLKMYKELGVDKFKISGRELAVSESFNVIKMVKKYNEYKYDGNLMELFKGFKKCYYSNMYYIRNDENLNKYLTSVLNNEIECNKYGCKNCMKCKDAVKSIITDEKEKERYLKNCKEIINQYKMS